LSVPATHDPLGRARTIARLLDSAVGVPGTRIRFGLDPVIGLVPGLGDLAGMALSSYLVILGGQLGVSRIVLLRMLANIALDSVGGMVPVVGDLFDVAWKSNLRNVALLERAIGEPSAARRASWLTVLGILLALAALAAAGIAVSVVVLRALFRS
jgi:Domain of unknown function (DUF4112)